MSLASSISGFFSKEAKKTQYRNCSKCGREAALVFGPGNLCGHCAFNQERKDEITTRISMKERIITLLDDL